MGKRAAVAAIAVVAVAAGMQLVRPETTNPPADPTTAFAAPQPAAAVLERSCLDCHSNRTVWPWYSKVAPASWLVAQDVKEGRTRLNFSEWNHYGPEMAALRLKAACKEASEGDMPPWQYTLVHRNAKPGAEGVAAICALVP